MSAKAENSHSNPILVIGGCGFLGSHIVDALIADKFSVVAASRNPRRQPKSSPPAEILMLATLFLIAEATSALVDNIKPCAIIQVVTAGPNAQQAAHAKDYEATKHLLQVSYESQSVKAFVYTSTAEVVANLDGLHKINEAEAVLHTRSSAPTSYAKFKALTDALVLRSSRIKSDQSSRGYIEFLRTASLRLPGIYGPRDGSITPGLLQGAHTVVSRLQFGENKSMNEWIYVESAARAHLLATKALLQDEAAGVDGEAFFLADDEPLRFRDFARKLWTAAGDKNASRSDKRIILPWASVVALATLVEVLTLIFTLGRVSPPMSRHHLQYMRFGAWWDIGKAREHLHYEPIVSGDEGIARTIAWFQQDSKP